MKYLFCLILTFLVIAVYGQMPKEVAGKAINPSIPVVPDTVFRVVHLEQSAKLKNQNLAVFVNDQFAGNIPVAGIPPEQIESITVEHKKIQVKGIDYEHQLYVETKSTYKPNLISLSDLKTKYTDLGNKPTVFSIDGEICTSDYSEYFIDESNLLRIIIDHISDKKEKTNLVLIKILSKNPENIKKVKDIRIRGDKLRFH
ncbi:hypothetical protein BWI97_17660 [Siphonobacter sp. BAB-5405]|uniref:hypothetical protein n=1 Tax=Siphonobacter sp. BAB-5405 TaxID=1864825 RepID=UPI000C805CCD|nr:hypothetical protein [Siphonobacter sp. BAB-5405]PMD93768.1 hypothetical protein BWI97_17660 [Siphonobacter sp. BAB-5405]